ncbi:MarR family winged helix-turn-helix transcriptional regulator [Gordonia sp. PKS22-38]|uniref:MarR family winged helix-turn-helix transcriptional regulator n=1 Tax=Gordonia prachuapensis TaxID=3115651 RepID=A0ABU7MUG8_9ACTN|nr:MarR family winged helix-turn-helix transcriptional regulator [Gordonia sp. PKS22-38]
MVVGHEESDRTLTASEREVWRTFVSGGWGLLAAINSTMSARGMSQADLRVLETLQDSRERSISELAAQVHMTVSTVSRQISRLVDEGSVERVHRGTDGRHRFVRITDHGRETLTEHVLVRDDLIRRLVIEQLTPDEFAMLGHVFGKIGANLSR